MSSDKQKVLLVRPEQDTRLLHAVRMITEPLDLEYLAAVATSEGWEFLIHDPLVTDDPFELALERFNPDIIGITGYYPTKDRMIEFASIAKEHRSNVLTVIGGVHAEINNEDFQNDSVDLIVHSGGTETFRNILRLAGNGATTEGIAGTCHRTVKAGWIRNEEASSDLLNLPLPDRTHFHENINKFRYLHYGPVALVKTAYGCPHNCRFCYCRLLNGGRYSVRCIEDVVDEIEAIACDRIWVVDDTFLIDRKRVVALANLLRERAVKKEFIIYSRSDFIAQNPDIVPILSGMGVIDVIIGFEAVEEKQLTGYDKQATVDEGRRAIRLLKDSGIESTGLFIMDIDAEPRDFGILRKWIAKSGLTTYTLSILTPFPGTELWERYSDRLVTRDCRKWDLSHLVMNPGGMHWLLFHALMIWMHLAVLFKNRKMRRHVLLHAGFRQVWS